MNPTESAADRPEDAEALVDIEQIMQEIRRQILARKDQVRPAGGPDIPLHGRRLGPQFYEHLYQAGLVYDQIGVRLEVTPNRTPVIGPLLHRLRTLLHTLVIFYVNKMAAEQIQFNTHILHAVSQLAQKLEEESAAQ